MNPQTQKRLYSVLEILAIIGFILGFFYDVYLLATIAGLLLVIDDILEILSGRLNPFFSIVFALILGFIIEPWYLGVIWSVVVFRILNIPKDIQVIVNPQRHKSLKEVEKESKEIYKVIERAL